MHQFYSRLRARLIPYIYSWARQTAEQGIPLLLRPLQLEFEHDVNCRGVMHEYLLGRDLLVTIYKKEIYLPEGYWKDFWNGKVYEGGRTYRIDWPENRGGGLFLRAGAIIPFAPVMQYRRERDIDEINLYLFPCDKKSTFEMYEDDGFSFDYRKGKFAVTPISCRNDGNSILIEIAAPCGDFIPAENRKWNITVAIPFSNPVLVLKDGVEVSGWDWNREQGELKVENLQAPSSLMIKLNANF
ncbi:MAG: DUF5110 domain-containing protein, partial [Lentisphaerae bacterium]|nr:DUF5110 domain-containing protein [Lentisphaerota bacterium]